MIQVNALTKKFGDFTALNALDCSIPTGCIYGMVGSNGAGKSTLLRLITGIYRPDGGNVTLDGKNVYENPSLKKYMVFVPDELYFLPQSSMERMAKTYASVYETFDHARFRELTESFKLNPKANLNTFSKGMKRQAATILALACKTDYLFLDETFDGLDPIMRNLVKKVLYADIAERNATAVITSHSLRELEDTFQYSYAEMLIARSTVISFYMFGTLIFLSMALHFSVGENFLRLALCGAVPSIGNKHIRLG